MNMYRSAFIPPWIHGIKRHSSIFICKLVSAKICQSKCSRLLDSWILSLGICVSYIDFCSSKGCAVIFSACVVISYTLKMKHHIQWSSILHWPIRWFGADVRAVRHVVYKIRTFNLLRGAFYFNQWGCQCTSLVCWWRNLLRLELFKRGRRV